jgi:hypothetical protein
MRPLAERAQDSHLLLAPDPERLLRLTPARVWWWLPVPIRDWVLCWGVPVLAVSDASTRMKQMSSFMPE